MGIVTDELTVTTLVNENQADKIGEMADELDGLAAALSLPLQDSVHVKVMRETLPVLSERLKDIVREATGEDPWA